MFNSAWLIGSIKDLPAHTTTIDGAAQILAAGSYYLHSSTAALSLLDKLVAMMTAAGVAAPVAVITRDRRVRLSAGGAFTVAWGASSTLRDLLGFTGDLAASSSYTATLISPLLWSPAKPVKSELSPRGTIGIKRPLAYYSMSPTDGSTFVVSHGERIDQRFTCTHIATARIQTAAEAGGEWAKFFLTVIAPGYSFVVYLDVTEDPGSTTVATLADGLGPYVTTPAGRAPAWAYDRSKGFEWTDRRGDWSISCRVCPEYS